jgi:phosphoserine phosphatase RsbU/P
MTTPDYARQIADLQALLQITRELAANTELKPLLACVELAARRVLDCERSTVFLYDEKTDELVSQQATGVDTIRFSAKQGIAGEVVRTGQIINVPDAYADPRFNPRVDQCTGFRTRNLLTFPLLCVNNRTVGVLQVLNKRSGAFTDWDREVVQAMGAQVGVAVQRQMLLDAHADKLRLQRDMNLARQIQQGLLPRAPANVPGYDITGWNRPADETGGDCFDHLLLHDGQVALTLADATGHGIGAALIMTECRALFHALITITSDLADVVDRVNNLLAADLTDGKFVTAFFGVLSPQDHVLTWVSAGQAPLFQYQAATGQLLELSASGVPAGIVANFPYDPPTCWTMEPGDFMVLVTDGFLECTNAAGEQFGHDRLKAVIRAHSASCSADIIRAMTDAIGSFIANQVQADDLTALVVRRC